MWPAWKNVDCELQVHAVSSRLVVWLYLLREHGEVWWLDAHFSMSQSVTDEPPEIGFV